MASQRYPWQSAYNAAAIETSPVLLSIKIYEAQSACEERRLTPVDGDEAQKLAEAEEVLKILQSERLDSFDAQS
jgi:hypothetical protein